MCPDRHVCTYKNHSNEYNKAAASGGMFNAVSRIITVIKLAPVTDGMANDENDVRILK